jgi:hypothetical protein
LKKKPADSFFLDTAELAELHRLLADMRKPPAQIAADKNLLTLIAGQFTVRMNNGRLYNADEIAPALGDLAD